MEIRIYHKIYIDIDTSYISKLVDIMQEKTDLPYGFSTHIMTDMELLNDTAHKSGGASSIQGFSLSDLNTFYTYRPKNASTQERLNSIQKLKDYLVKITDTHFLRDVFLMEEMRLNTFLWIAGKGTVHILHQVPLYY